MSFKQCPLCGATVQVDELQGKQMLCEVCRLFIAEETKQGGEAPLRKGGNMTQVITLKGTASQVFKYFELLVKVRGKETLGELVKEVS